MIDIVLFWGSFFPPPFFCAVATHQTVAHGRHVFGHRSSPPPLPHFGTVPFFPCDCATVNALDIDGLLFFYFYLVFPIHAVLVVGVRWVAVCCLNILMVYVFSPQFSFISCKRAVK